MLRRRTASHADAVLPGRVRAALLAAALILGGGAAGPAGATVPDWGDVAAPSSGPPEVIGTYGSGCLAGAVGLPPEGEGYQAVDLERLRYFGHPRMIGYIEDLGRRAAATGLGTLLVGDIAQPRGGPMSYGHLSHQVGLDVDIWYRLDLPPLPRGDAREGIPQPSVLDPVTGLVDPRLWTDDHAELVRLAATDPRVARVFVDPAIKRDLCMRDWPEGRGWLRLVRPWPAHDDHMHVRLHCPADAPDCVPQLPPAPGEGCGAELDAWFGAAPPPVAMVPNRTPPPACLAVLLE